MLSARTKWIYVRGLMVIYLLAHTVASSATGGAGYFSLEHYLRTTCRKKSKLRTLRDSRMARHRYIGIRAYLELVNVETIPPGPSSVSRR
ncbi:hypothetical protein EDB83DRAFT_2431027 [Lactarius deliciosus]|nr:hypothetical protein EDB83DRAFT_2431027 [Lactarius deliciosus]